MATRQKSQRSRTRTHTQTRGDALEYDLLLAVHGKIRQGDQAPPCWGLSFIPGSWLTAGEKVIAQDKGSCWLSTAFLPRGTLRGVDHNAWLAEVRSTTHRYGVPQVGPGGVEKSYLLTREGGLPADADARLRGVLLDTLWGCLSVGFRCKKHWADKRDGFLSLLSDPGSPDTRSRRRYLAWLEEFQRDHGRKPTREERHDNMLLFGGYASSHEGVIHHKRWMPRPLLAFPDHLVEGLFDTITRQKLVGEVVRAMPLPILNWFLSEVSTFRAVPVRSPLTGVFQGAVRGDGHDGCVASFLEDDRVVCLALSGDVELTISHGEKVHCGQLIGLEAPWPLPADWDGMTQTAQAACLRRLVGRQRLDKHISQWFRRHCLHVAPGYVHVPQCLGQYASRYSVSEQLYWDVTPALDYYVEELDSFILPSFNERPPSGENDSRHRWLVRDDTREFLVDVTPQEEGYQSKPCPWREEVRDRVGDQLAYELFEYRQALDAAQVEEEALIADRLAEARARNLLRVMTPAPVPALTPDPELDPTPQILRRNKRKKDSSTLKVFSGEPNFPKDLDDNVLDSKVNGNK